MSHGHDDIQKHVGVYLKVFAALAVLTLATVLAADMQVSTGMHWVVAMLIAIAKGSLVCLFFMHMLTEKKLTYWVLTLTVGFFLLLLFLPAISLSDHADIRKAQAPAAVAPAGHGEPNKAH